MAGSADSTGKGATLERSTIAVAMAGTLALGLWLRWALTGHVGIRGEFANLRHAHSHLGYFGVLFPLAWAAWGRAGAVVPSPRLLGIYAAATGLAFVGFVRAGYGPEAIAGSTVVGLVWMASAWPLWPRIRDTFDPLAVVPLGVLGGMACVPPIAMNLERAPEVAQGFVATFLAALLLGVIVPSALAVHRHARTPWVLLAVGAAASAAALGVYPSALTRAGLLLYAALLFRHAWSGGDGYLRLAWSVVAIGLAGIAVGVLPNTRPIAVGSIHFLILGPVLTSLTPPGLRERVPEVAWFVYLAAVALLTGPLVLQGLGVGGWTLLASATGGTAVVVWWLAVGVGYGREFMADAPPGPSS